MRIGGDRRQGLPADNEQQAVEIKPDVLLRHGVEHLAEQVFQRPLRHGEAHHTGFYQRCGWESLGA